MKRKARVLFVDDEKRIVHLLRLMFRNTYEVHIATGGVEALGVLRRHPIDVLVSDHRMPGMSGVELLEHAARESPHTVRILLTGYADLAAIVSSVNEGEVFRFVTKPWGHDDIHATLAEAVEVAMMARPTPALATARAPAKPATPVRKPGVLVLDDNASDRAQIASSLGGAHPLHYAASVPEALALLEAHDIGVMVCEAHVSQGRTSDLLEVLKANFAAIMTVMLTRAADSDDVIRLINHARIYRFATKPIRPPVLQLAVSAAMKEHLRCVSDPRHAARQRVPTVVAEAPTLAQSIMQSLRGLTARWRLFGI